MNEPNIYEALGEDSTKIDIKRRSDLRNLYYGFLSDFKNYLVDFVRESMFELVIGEIPVSVEPIRICEENETGRYITIKNQGNISCYLSMNGKGGFRLDGGEKERFWVNKMISATTISGSTTLGIIKS